MSKVQKMKSVSIIWFYLWHEYSSIVQSVLNSGWSDTVQVISMSSPNSNVNTHTTVVKHLPIEVNLR